MMSFHLFTRRRGAAPARTIACAFALLCALINFSRADSPHREIEIRAAEGKYDKLVQVAQPTGRFAAVSDVAGMLVVAGRPILRKPEPQLAFFPLDEKGQPKPGDPIKVDLPQGDAFGARRSYVLSLAVHPMLPLLYVWQDIAAPPDGASPDDPTKDGFSRLLIYDLSTSEPKLVQSAAQGDDYWRGATGGSICLGLNASRLFVPNLIQRDAKGIINPAIGFLRLDEDGLVNEDASDVQITGGGARPKDKETVAIGAVARRALREANRTGTNPIITSRVARNATNTSVTFAGFPCGLGFFPVSETTTIVCGALGPLTWDETNRRGQFNNVTIYPLVGVGYLYRMAGHPELPVVFLSGINSTFVYRMEHVDGFLTLTPQRGTIAGTNINGPPVLLGRERMFACGGANVVHLVKYDEQGYLGGERIDVPVNCGLMQALAYSSRFDRLYAAVEKVTP